MDESCNCDNFLCQTKAMLIHHIDGDEFKKIVKAFFGVDSSKVTPLRLKLAEVKLPVYDQNTTCDHFIDFTKIDMGRIDNSDITFHVSPPPAPQDGVKYSIALFKGIISMLKPSTFDFYKAKSNFGSTICFKTTLITGEILYWDLSNRYPPLIDKE